MTKKKKKSYFCSQTHGNSCIYRSRSSGPCSSFYNIQVTESIGALHRVLIQSPKCLSGEVSIRGESEGWLSGCLGALQRPSAMTPSGYSDTLQTSLAWAAKLSDCLLPTTGNLCTRPAHTLTPPAITNVFRLCLHTLPWLFHPMLTELPGC